MLLNASYFHLENSRAIPGNVRSAGRQRILLVGCTKLDPGKLIGIASAPLLCVALETFHGPPPLYPRPFFRPSFQTTTALHSAPSFSSAFLPSPPSALFSTVYSLHINRIVPGDAPPLLPGPLLPSPLPLPPTALLARSSTDDRTAYERSPLHLQKVNFCLYGPGWTLLF